MKDPQASVRTPRRTYGTGSIGSLDTRPEAKRPKDRPKGPLGFAPPKEKEE